MSYNYSDIFQAEAQRLLPFPSLMARTLFMVINGLLLQLTVICQLLLLELLMHKANILRYYNLNGINIFR